MSGLRIQRHSASKTRVNALTALRSIRGARASSGQQPLPRHVIELKPDAIRIFEQQRVIARRPLILARRTDDPGADRRQKAVQLVDVGALAGAEAEMVQADTLLFERCAFICGRRR